MTVPQTLRGASAQAGTIFVSIASYRDPKTRWTVWDLFKKVWGSVGINPPNKVWGGLLSLVPPSHASHPHLSSTL